MYLLEYESPKPDLLGGSYKKEKSATCWSDHRTVIPNIFPCENVKKGANCMETQGLKLPFQLHISVGFPSPLTLLQLFVDDDTVAHLKIE